MLGRWLAQYEEKAMAQCLENRAQQPEVPAFRAGDFLKVSLRVKESSGKTRVQIFEGVCIARRNSGLGSTFRVRRLMDDGVGIERTFMVYSPTIEEINVQRYGKVRRAKLYYLRAIKGRKGGRIAEDKKRTQRRRDALAAA